MRTLIYLIVIVSFFILTTQIYSQEETGEDTSMEIFVIDSYITPEIPHKFVLSFFTSAPAKSKVLLQNKFEFTVSEDFTEDHKTEIDISGIQFDSLRIPFYVLVEDSLGDKYNSERYEVTFPEEFRTEIKTGSSRLLTCCFGGIIFGLPAPTYVNIDGEDYFSLTKEIPFLSVYKSNFRYPIGFLSFEYAYIFKAPLKNHFRLGYKHIFEVPYIQYISPGINGVTNFDGFNGVSPELTLGLFNFYDIFTIFAKYRYTFQPGQSKLKDFHEIGIGLYSNFFTFRLDL